MTKSNQHGQVLRHDLSLCLAILPEHVIAYQSDQGEAWQIVPIKGNPAYSHRNQPDDAQTILADLTRRFNLDNNNLTEVNISLLYVSEQARWIGPLLQALLSAEFANDTWQVLNWHQLYQYACQLSKHKAQLPQDYLEHEWIMQYMLPLLWQENSLQQHKKILDNLHLEKQLAESQLQSRQSSANTEYSALLLKLEQEKILLQQQVTQTQQQLANLQQPDLEQLLAYLPFIFKDFWNVVRPDELANLAGVLKTPTVPSPYHSPSISAVQQKKRQFLAQPPDQQQRVIGYCRELVRSYNALSVHPEFKVLVGELD